MIHRKGQKEELEYDFESFYDSIFCIRKQDIGKIEDEMKKKFKPEYHHEIPRSYKVVSLQDAWEEYGENVRAACSMTLIAPVMGKVLIKRDIPETDYVIVKSKMGLNESDITSICVSTYGSQNLLWPEDSLYLHRYIPSFSVFGGWYNRDCCCFGIVDWSETKFEALIWSPVHDITVELSNGKYVIRRAGRRNVEFNGTVPDDLESSGNWAWKYQLEAEIFQALYGRPKNETS